MKTTLIKLYDNPASIHAQYARIVLDEAGVEYRKVLIDLPLGNLEPSYAKINPNLGIPSLEIITNDDDENTSNNSGTTTTSLILTDSRDIINYCKGVKGRGDKLFPKNRIDEINEILDLIYDANGGQISFQSYLPRDPIFKFALNKIMAPIRSAKIKRYLSDPNIINNNSSSSNLKKVYENAAERIARPGPCLEELTIRAEKTMSVLDEKLKKNGGPWLLGKDHTAVDCVASIWVQWIVWSNEIVVTPRVLDFLCRSKQTSSWKSCDAIWVIPFVRNRIYAATTVLTGCIIGIGVYLFAKKYGPGFTY